jgi:transposase
MISIDYIWFAAEPMNMRAGTYTALAKVISVFGAAQQHCAYLFANRRANRMMCRGMTAWGYGWRRAG